MIPNGQNPHGLEDRLLTFSVLENNNPVYMIQSKNRLYCWATFPQALKNYIMDTYSVGEDDLRLSMEIAEDQASWDTLMKYVSKEKSGNHFMVHSDKNFYYQTWVYSSNIPDFATIYVLDTSGSMDGSDYNKVKQAIAGEIYDYNCYEESTNSSKMYVYSAANLNSMNVLESVFGTISFGEATLSQIWDAVSPFIDGVPRNKSSESMFTNLYYSIASTIKRLFVDDGHATPGKNCELSAATFILFTDESIFTPDSLDFVEYLYDSTQPSGQKKGIWFSQWFKDWTDSTSEGHNKFPTEKSWTSSDKRRTFCQSITNALKQMSYYYGVSFTWGLYGGLSTSRDDTKAVKGDDTQTGTAIWLNKVDSISTDEESIVYEGGTAWTIPSDFHITYPHESMYRIGLEIPSEHIKSGQNALKDSLIMQYNDQFNPSLIMAHFWKDGAGEYSAFRFNTDNGKTITLPATEEMNLVEINPETGAAYQYKWMVYGQSQEIPPKIIACGGNYTIDYDADTYGNKSEVRFKLIKE